MKNFNLIYGISGTGKSQYLYNDIKSKINTYKNIFIIVPEQSNLTSEKKLFEITGEKAFFNCEVLTLSRMAYRISNEIGEEKEHLSKIGKSMIIYDLLNKNKKNLKFLGKSEKNVDIVDKLFTELKKHNISIDNLENISIDDNYVNLKLEDVKKLYEQYENKIEEKFVDENDILSVLAQNIEKSNMFDNCAIYFDDFYGFTPQEYNIFEELMKKCDEISCAVCIDNIESNKIKENDIFYFNRKYAKKLLEIADRNDCKINLVNLRENYRLKNDELKALEKILIGESCTYKQKNQYVELFLANNSYSEMENTAKEIYDLVKNRGYKYNEIAVSTSSIENYADEAKAVFAKYNLPIFIDVKKDLNQNILIRYIISLVDIYVNNWSFESVFNYLKIGLLDIDYSDICLLENYCVKWGIRSSKWYKQEFCYEPKNDIQEKLENLRKQIVNPILELKEKFNKNKTTNELTKDIYEFLIENKVLDNLDKKIKQSNSIEINNEYNTSYKILVKILEEMNLIFGEEKITFSRFRDLLNIGIKSSELGMIPATQDQVILNDIDRSRSDNIKVLFVVGINDGCFPKVNMQEGYFNDQDRSILLENGIELAKDSVDSMLENQFNTYRTLVQPQEKLYLSYCSTDRDGKSLRPSMLIKKIKNTFKLLEEKSDIISNDINISNYKSTFENALKKYKDFLKGKEIEEEWRNLIIYFYNNNSQDFENAVKGFEYTNNTEKLDKDNVKKLYGNTLNTTISRLENYKKCPFSYHLTYGLKLKENDKFEMTSLDTGSFMHEVIDEFFEYIDNSNINVKEISNGEVKNIVNKIIDDILQSTRYYIFKGSGKFKMMTKRLSKVVIDSILYIVYTLKYSDFKPVGHEVEFGQNCKYEPIKLKLENGENIEITGKIDRLDVGKLNDKEYVRIIDYKSQVKTLDMNKVTLGLQIQLITYLDAVVENEGFEPSGMLYLGLVDNIIKSQKNLDDSEIETKIKNEFKMRGVILADVNVIKMMDNKLTEGQSDIVPAYITKTGEISEKKSSVLKKEEFEDLQKEVKSIIKQMSTEILDGNIDIKPYKYRNESGCDYCKYKSICMYLN